MSATTDFRAGRSSPARWSKLAASALSAGALLGIVHLLSATAQQTARQPPAAPSADYGRGSGLPAATIAPTEPAPAAAVPAPVPAPTPAGAAPAAPVAPHAVSKASGG